LLCCAARGSRDPHDRDCGAGDEHHCVEKIGKTESHGCIRLTNWDALDLAGMVHRGTVVDFVG
jgi:hypothetical protein